MLRRNDLIFIECLEYEGKIYEHAIGQVNRVNICDGECMIDFLVPNDGVIRAKFRSVQIENCKLPDNWIDKLYATDNSSIGADNSTSTQVNDAVNHPSHYTDGKIEVIDFIEDKGLNFHRGNAVKYIARAGKKNPDKEIEDLQKAVWYIQREIERLNKLKASK